MDIQRKAFESSNNVNPDWSFKFDEELQQYVATDFEMTNQVDEFNEHWDTFRAGWEAKAQAVPAEFEIGQLKDRITELLDERQDLYAQINAQAVPDTYTPIVLALESVQSKIAKTSFLTMDEENENEVMAVDANELAAYIDKLIEAQEPTQ